MNPIIDTLVDIRDGNQYELIRINDQWWFNENLRYQSEGAVAFQNEEHKVEQRGFLYPYSESKSVCPTGWKLPTVSEYDDLLDYLAGTSTLGLWSTPIEWDGPVFCIQGFRFQQTGYQHKRRFKAPDSMNFWLDDQVPGHHVHIYLERSKKVNPPMLLFHHEHERRKPIIGKRSFAVRCVCSVEEEKKSPY
ncbi:MAG: FISUMP domain-containing protein [Bacteroidota bacterium]